mmetsp:Transcript_12709/g.33316  ORF Transcript_12709/g.33316 Transcript_12709/m.33316 type:complete len:212 (-) Transcript_12709:797-1432(-)
MASLVPGSSRDTPIQPAHSSFGLQLSLRLPCLPSHAVLGCSQIGLSLFGLTRHLDCLCLCSRNCRFCRYTLRASLLNCSSDLATEHQICNSSTAAADCFCCSRSSRFASFTCCSAASALPFCTAASAQASLACSIAFAHALLLTSAASSTLFSCFFTTGSSFGCCLSFAISPCWRAHNSCGSCVTHGTSCRWIGPLGAAASGRQTLRGVQP